MGEVHASSITFVLPAYNERDNIQTAVAHVTQVGGRLFGDHEVVVVDDGSTDGTGDLVRQMGADDPRIRCVPHDGNLGYGEALRSGFLAATKDLVFLTDADNQFDVNELERFVPYLDRADVVAGYRVNRQDPLIRRFFAKAWNVLVRALFYVPVRDIDCAFKLFRRETLEDLELASVGAMVSTELMVKLGRSGRSVVELGVTHLPRTAGTARGAHPRVIALAVRELIRMRRTLRPVDVASGHRDPATRSR
ncbi:MAG TPA: glycosyltransferase family 2 protein [Nitriliruptorales bacterium]